MSRHLAAGLLHKTVQSAIPPDPTRHVRTPLFEFLMPWPWDPAEPGWYGLTADEGLVAFAAAPRSDGAPAIFRAWNQPLTWTMATVKPKAIMRDIARVHNGRNPHVERIKVGGVPGLLIGMTSPTNDLLMFLALPYRRHNTLVEGCFQVPAHQPGYRHHIDTMLSTWRWV